MENYTALTSAVENYDPTVAKLKTDVDDALKQGDRGRVGVIYSAVNELIRNMLDTGQEIGLGDGSGNLRRRLDIKVTGVEKLKKYIEKEAGERKIPLDK